MEQKDQVNESNTTLVKEFVTKTEFAKRVNRSTTDIGKAIRNGIIEESDEVRGRIEYISQRKRWDARYVGKQNLATMKQDADKAIASGASEENSTVAMYNSRARREKALADKAELQAEQLKGLLVRRSEVEKAVAEWAQMIKERMMDIPDRISPKESSDIVTYIAAVSSGIVENTPNITASGFSEQIIKQIDTTDIERIIVKNWEASIRYLLAHIDDRAGYIADNE